MHYVFKAAYSIMIFKATSFSVERLNIDMKISAGVDGEGIRFLVFFFLISCNSKHFSFHRKTNKKLTPKGEGGPPNLFSPLKSHFCL